MNQKIAITLFFVIFFWTEGCGGSVLNRISRVQNGGSVQFLAYFDERPVYDAQFGEKRLDVIMEDTAVHSDFVPPPAGNAIVRTSVAQDRGTLVLSIFFRYAPQHLKVETGPTNNLAVTLVPGNRFTKTYRELMNGLGPIETVENHSETTVGPSTFSPYASDWRSFIEQYHGFSFIELRPRPVFPAFPLSALLPQAETAPLQISYPLTGEFSAPEWFDALAQVQKRLKDRNSEQERKFLALTHADLLYRLGNSRLAQEQFSLLEKKYPDTEIGRIAQYAWIVIEAQEDHFYKAQILLERLLAQETGNSTLAPFIRLSLAECFLATGQPMRAQPYLEEPNSLTGKAAIRKDIRRADVFFAAKRHEQAGIIFASHADSTHLALQPYSLNNYCTLLYRQENFKKSAQCYRRLESGLPDPDKQAAAHYLSALSQLQSEEDPAVNDMFEELARRFPGSDTGWRAEIKRADLCYLGRPDCSAEALKIYQNAAESSISRDISQEARLKSALIHHFSGNDRKTVAVLDELLRNYQSGSLRDEALALLVETLPGVLSDLLERNQDIAALSLAQQNRSLFVNDWLDHSFLFQLGLAFERLSLNRDALNLFLYLRRFVDFRLDEELIFALARVSHALSDQNLVEDFSSSYLLHFPDGEHRQNVLYYLIDASLDSGQFDRALNLLPNPLPRHRDFRLLAAAVNFFADNHQAAADLLLQLNDLSGLSENYRFILAESLFRNGRLDRCTELYEQLIETGTYKDLSRFRLAQIAGTNENKDRSNAVSRLADAGTEKSPWVRLFAQQQKFDQLSQ